jgi:hypothetical protein
MFTFVYNLKTNNYEQTGNYYKTRKIISFIRS